MRLQCFLFTLPFLYFYFDKSSSYDVVYWISTYSLLAVLSYKNYKSIPYYDVINKSMSYGLTWLIVLTGINYTIPINILYSTVFTFAISFILYGLFLLRGKKYKLNNFESSDINNDNVFIVFYRPISFLSFLYALFGGLGVSGCFCYYKGYTHGFKRKQGFVSRKSSGVFKEGYIIINAKWVNPVQYLSTVQTFLLARSRFNIFGNVCYSFIREACNIKAFTPYSILIEAYNKSK